MAPASLLFHVFVLTVVSEARRLGERTRDGRAIPGVPGQDYPNFSTVPRTSFSCFGRSEGFYADPEARCQVFHICPAETSRGQGVSQSFLCPNGTIFNARVNTCDWWNKVQCHGDVPDLVTVSPTIQPASLRTDGNYKQYDNGFQVDQFRRHEAEKVLLDNQVTESRIHRRRNNEFTNTANKNDIHIRTDNKNNPFTSNFKIRRVKVVSSTDNVYSSNTNPETVVPIRPRVKYITKSLRPAKDNLYSLNPIVQVARDSSLLSTFIDPSEEKTTDRNPDRVRKPTQRYAVQGVLPQYKNTLSQVNPSEQFSSDDSLQPDRERNVFTPTEISLPNNFQGSQEQEGVIENSNSQSSIAISTPNLNNDGAITQTGNEFKVSSDSNDNPIPNDRGYIPPSSSIEGTKNVESSSGTIVLGNTDLGRRTLSLDIRPSLNGDNERNNFLKLGSNTEQSSVNQNINSESNTPQTIRVSSGYSFNSGNNINTTPNRVSVSGSYSVDDQFPTSNSGTGFENSGGKIPETSNMALKASSEDVNQFGIVNNQEVKTVNKFIATEPEVPKSGFTVEGNEFDKSSEALTPEFNDSTSESDLEAYLMSIFGGTSIVSPQSDISSSTTSTSVGSTKDDIPTTPTVNQTTTETPTGIINTPPAVFTQRGDANIFTTVGTNTLNRGQSPGVVNGALNFNFKFDPSSPSEPDVNLKTSEQPIYYGHVITTNSDTPIQSDRINTLKPSDQAYFSSPKTHGHFITKAPIDSKPFRFHYNKTTPQDKFDGYSQGIPQTVDNKYQYNAFSGDPTRTNHNLPPFTSSPDRQNIPSFGSFESFQGFTQSLPNTFEGSYQRNNFIGGPSTSLPNNVQQTNDGNYHQIIESGYRYNFPSFRFTMNTTPFPPVAQRYNSGNYHRTDLHNAFFLGNRPAFENSHLALPEFPPQNIFYSTYPDYRISSKQTGTLSTQPPVSYPIPSQISSVNTPNRNNNFETIINESIGSIASKDPSSQYDSSKVSSTTASPTFPISQTVNEGISTLLPGSTLSSVQPSVEAYSASTTAGSNGFENNFVSNTPGVSSSSFDQSKFSIFPTTQYNSPIVKSTSDFSNTRNFISSLQPVGPTSPIPPSNSDVRVEINQNSITSERPYLTGVDIQQTDSGDEKDSATEKINASDFRTLNPSSENNFQKQSSAEGTFGSESTDSLPNSTPSSLGSKDSSNPSPEGVSDKNTLSVPSAVPFSTPKPFLPFGEQQGYLPPYLDPSILPHYSIPGRQLFTPMDLFSINNLPRPTATSITHFSSADIVRSISFSFDTSEEREAFEQAQAKGLFDR